MPKAVYLGSAATYNIGPHAFKPGGVEVSVSDEIANVLRNNSEFTIDGVGGLSPAGEGVAVNDGRNIPAGGFTNREAAAAFAAKWLPDLTLNMDRSTAELTRVIDAALLGVTTDAETGEPIAPAMAAAAASGKNKPKGKAVAV